MPIFGDYGYLSPIAYRYTFEEDMKEDSLEAGVVISSVTRQDSGLFSCMAENSFGKDTRNIQLLVLG